GPVLQGPIDPAGTGVESPASFEATWRTTAAGRYYFVLYLPSCADPTSCAATTATITLHGTAGATQVAVYHEARTLPLHAAGALTDRFEPYALHVYTVP